MNNIHHNPGKPGGVWSAAPTPLTENKKVHTGDVKRMVDHHNRLGVNGLFLAGSNGEGCWLSGEKKLLVEMGILSTWKNFPNYPLTKTCIRAIERVLEKDIDVLLP